MAELIPVGAQAPEFDLSADDGGRVALSGLKGRKLVLYFYPKADTPGCTQEAIDFNRLRPKFEAAGTSILGISADPVPHQAKFRSKYNLAFPLASDPAHGMLEAYGVWGEKTLFGRKYLGVRRVTYLIGADGRVAKVWPNVKVPGHAEAVLAEAKKL
jgi:peroxiredoxin Q/BCP